MIFYKQIIVNTKIITLYTTNPTYVYNFTQHIARIMMTNQAFITKFATKFDAIIAHPMLGPTVGAIKPHFRSM